MDLDRILRISQVLDLVGISNATLHRWVKEGDFPAPVKLGANSVGWKASAIHAWIESREPAGGPKE